MRVVPDRTLAERHQAVRTRIKVCFLLLNLLCFYLKREAILDSFDMTLQHVVRKELHVGEQVLKRASGADTAPIGCV